ncbi:hypothetical protein MERGE_001990 [Pneumocystis wakefieldiae]|uniref:GATA-type domain-containing protein n=1 Tax=Pneumocystis wakefieldiae TaxID=38082 RepID=A0A899G015_9ASCO|nr:hypothetical protein MERGE_001990 [Pneumocystis wakefieldiae]
MARSRFIFLQYPIHKKSDKILGVDVNLPKENDMSINTNNVYNPYMDKDRSCLFSQNDQNNMHINYDYISEDSKKYFDYPLSSSLYSSSGSLAMPFSKYPESNGFLVDINQFFSEDDLSFPSNSPPNLRDDRFISDSCNLDTFVADSSGNFNSVLGISSSGNAPKARKNDPVSSIARKNVCFNCGVNETPLWRRSPDKKYLLCNACGLYLKQYKYMRPLEFRRKRPTTTTQRPTIKLVCVNCEVTETSLWRKNEFGKPICNACRLYEKIHNTQRPVTMRKEQVIRRRRYKNLFERI